MEEKKIKREQRVKKIFKNHFDFLDEKALNRIHGKIEKGTTMGELKQHMLENHRKQIKSEKKTYKRMDNILQSLSGKKRGRSITKKVLEHSENKYIDPSKKDLRKVFWWAPTKKKAEKAGKNFQEKEIKNRIPEKTQKKRKKRSSDWKDVKRYKKRLLNESKNLTRLRKGEHEKIFEKALNEIVGEMVDEGWTKKQIKTKLCSDREIIKDFIDMDKIKAKAKRGMGEVIKANIENKEGKDLNKKQINFIYKGHLAHEISKEWDRKIEAAIERKKNGHLLLIE